MKISDLIREVRENLVQSQIDREASKALPLFALEQFELELNCIVTTGEAGGSGINLKILAIDDKSSISIERVQKIKLIFGTVQPGATQGQRKPQVNNVANSNVLPPGSLPSQSACSS